MKSTKYANACARGGPYYGLVNGLKAYSRPHQVVCLLPEESPPVQIGVKSEPDLQTLADEWKVPLYTDTKCIMPQ